MSSGGNFSTQWPKSASRRLSELSPEGELRLGPGLQLTATRLRSPPGGWYIKDLEFALTSQHTMAFSLPGNNPITALRRILARCLAYSRTYNTRNLEYYWYPSWNHTLFDLIANNPYLVVAPQFPLYVSPDLPIDDQGERDEDVDEDPDADQGTVDDEDPDADQGEADDDATWLEGAAAAPPSLPPALSFLDSEPEDDSGDELADLLADTSFFSTASTTPDSKALTRVTDFAILHLRPQQNAALRRRYEGYRVAQLTVPLLMEEKRFPSRSLIGNAFHDKLKVKIREAQQDAVFQVVLLFRKFPEMSSVMVIAASGPWWSNTRFQRAANVHMSEQDFAKAMRAGDYADLYRTVVHKRWSIPLRLDTYSSTQRFKAIHNTLVAL